MSTITLPTNLPLGPGSGMGQRRYDIAGASDTTGAEQTRVLGPPRWALQLVQPQALTVANAARWQSLILQLRGRVNRLAAYDPLHRAPRGTLRGTLTLAAGVSIGDTTLSLSGSTGTILEGDMLQIGTGLGTSQLVMAVADGTHAGVTFEPPARVAFSSGVGVTWDHPRAYFRLSTDASSWTYGPAGRVVTGMSFDLLETWS